MNETNRILEGGPKIDQIIEKPEVIPTLSQVEHATKYEQTRAYDQLGGEAEALKYDGWGNVFNGERWTNYYRDPQFMDEVFSNEILRHLEETGRALNDTLLIADLGGADGQLAHHLATQLAAAGYENAHVINADLNGKALLEAYKNYPELKIVRTDLLNLPFTDESLDVVTSRFVMQYFAGKYAPLCPVSQQDLLDEMYRVIKKDGLVILNYFGGRNEQEEEGCAQLMASLAHISGTGDFQETLYTKGCSTLERVAEFAEKSGFSVESAEETAVSFFFSAESFADRFNFPEDRKEEITARLDEIIRHGAAIGLEVREVEGKDGKSTLAVYGPILRVVLKSKNDLLIKTLENECET